MFVETAYAMGASGGDQAAQGAGGQFSSLILMLFIFGIFYFLMIRPQQKRMKEHKKMVNELKKGDRIVTAGGMYGTVENVMENTLTVKIAEGVKVKITRGSIGSVVKDEDEKE